MITELIITKKQYLEMKPQLKSEGIDINNVFYWYGFNIKIIVKENIFE